MASTLDGGTARPAFRLPPALIYVVSVGLDKGFSLLTIPLVAAYLSPRDYGRLDVAMSLVEFCGIVLSMGIAETLIRFAGPLDDPWDRRRTAARLLGTGLALALGLGALLQALAPLFAAALGIGVSQAALRFALAGAAATSLIELPLVWLRLEGRTAAFVGFIAARSVGQFAMMVVMLRSGHGADGILMANGATLVAIAAVLAIAQWRQSGIAFDATAHRQIGAYGLPLVGSALAMFALGNCNRWFLSGAVPDADIAYLGLASKFALVTPLLLQPFLLWWSPRRIAALGRPNGMSVSRWAWGLGFSVLVLSGLAVALAAPVFVALVLPKAYAGALSLLPLVVLVCALNELNSLSNVGAYARKTGFTVLSVNVSGAACSIAGYLALIGPFGVRGAIGAMILGHLTRLALFLSIGRAMAPIHYPLTSAFGAFVLAAAAVALAPGPAHLLAHLAWSAAALATIAAALMKTGLLALPERYLPLFARGYVPLAAV